MTLTPELERQICEALTEVSKRYPTHEWYGWPGSNTFANVVLMVLDPPKPEPKVVAHYPLIYGGASCYRVTDQLYSEVPVGVDGRLAKEYPPIMLPVEE